jgi:hypothetical protein
MARVFQSAADEIALADRFRRCPKVTRYDGTGHDEASQLAHGFADLEEETHRFVAALPKLMASEDCDSINDQLLEIGESLRHILRDAPGARGSSSGSTSQPFRKSRRAIHPIVMPPMRLGGRRLADARD